MIGDVQQRAKLRVDQRAAEKNRRPVPVGRGPHLEFAGVNVRAVVTLRELISGNGGEQREGLESQGRNGAIRLLPDAAEQGHLAILRPHAAQDYVGGDRKLSEWYEQFIHDPRIALRPVQRRRAKSQ